MIHKFKNNITDVIHTIYNTRYKSNIKCTILP